MRSIRLFVRSVMAGTLLFLLIPVSGLAQMPQVVVKVDGLACPFCAYGLEKKLKRIEGVEKVEINVKGGTTALRTKPGRTLDLDEVAKAVREGGFTPRTLTVTVTGEIREWNSRPVIQLTGTDDRFLIDQNAQLKQLQTRLRGQKKLVILTGTVSKKEPTGHGGHPYGLSIEQFTIK